MSVATATVTQVNLTGSPLLWQDTGSYGTIVSRTLVISDYLGNVITTQNLGTALNYQFVVTSDSWYSFVCIVVDNTSTFTSTVYYVSTGFYWNTYLAQFNATNCGCNGNNCNLELSQLSLQAALRFNLGGLPNAASAQKAIVAANFFVNQNIVAKWQ